MSNETPDLNDDIYDEDIPFDDAQEPVKTPLLPNSVYDRLRVLVEVVLPAAATLYFTLAQIWEFPNAEKVVGSITAVILFLGVLIKLSDKSYNNSDAKYDGELNVLEDSGKTVFSLDLFGDPEELTNKNDILFRVK